MHGSCISGLTRSSGLPLCIGTYSNLRYSLSELGSCLFAASQSVWLGSGLELARATHYCSSSFPDSLGTDSDLRGAQGSPVADHCSCIKECFYSPQLPLLLTVFRIPVYINDKNRAALVWEWERTQNLVLLFPEDLPYK